MHIKKSVFLLLALFYNNALGYTRFPAGRCLPQNCTTYSPYIFESNNSVLDNIFCVDVIDNNCDYNNACCNSLKNQVQKIVFDTTDKCYGSIEKITLNNVKKSGGVYFDNYTGFAELRITNLLMNYYSFLGSKLCIYLKEPCSTIREFCTGSKCIYSIYDPFTHECCPVCIKNFDQGPIIPDIPDRPNIPNIPDRPNIPNIPNIHWTPNTPYIPYKPGTPSIPGIPNSPYSIPNNPDNPNIPTRPIMPKNPPPYPNNNTDTFRLIIKAPIIDATFVRMVLCESLEMNYNSNSNSCKITFTSTTGIYYGISISDDYRSFVNYIVQNLGYFTMINNILCESTILISHDTFERRYRASPESCTIYYPISTK